jgi:hypothetical protein
VDELQNAQRGLLNRVKAINARLSKIGSDFDERAALLDELSQASKLLDKSEEFLPR